MRSRLPRALAHDIPVTIDPDGGQKGCFLYSVLTVSTKVLKWFSSAPTTADHDPAKHQKGPVGRPQTLSRMLRPRLRLLFFYHLYLIFVEI